MTQSADHSFTPAVAALVAVWLLITVLAGIAGLFQASPGQPPLPVLVALLTPPLVFTVAWRGSSRFRDYALALDQRLLAAVQGWRVIGGMFLVLYAYGMLPGLFALPAGVGDLAVGLAAPFVVHAIANRAPDWPRRVLWLNIAGLVDFAAAVVTGVLTSPSAIGVFADPAARAGMGEFPLSLIPTFAVPLWIVAHIVALLQLAHRRRAAGG